MGDDDKMSSSETAYRAVVEYQEAGKRLERARAWGPDVSNTQSTPFIVWGAFLGFMIGAFSGVEHGFVAGLGAMLAGMAIGAGLFWSFGKALRWTCWGIGAACRTIFKLVKGQPLEPPV